MRVDFMKKLLVILGMLLMPSILLAAPTKQQLSKGMVNPGFIAKPGWFKLSFLDIQEDVAEAKAKGKRVMLYFYQDGCPYCKKLITDNFTDPVIIKKLKKGFDVVAINMWGDKEVTDMLGNETIEKKYALQRKVMYTPTIIFLDEKGAEALRINGYYYPKKFSAALDYVSQKKEGKISFLQFYKQASKPKVSGKLHIEDSYLQPPYNLKKTLAENKRPLLVMFEQPDCKLCDELHLDVLKKPEAASAIKAFDVVVLNQYSRGFITTPAGKQMRINQWAKKMDIKFSPSLVFFDTSGKEVFRTEAYLRTFHITGAMTYVSSGSYKTQPSFQRYLQGVNEAMTKKGIKVDLMR